MRRLPVILTLGAIALLTASLTAEAQPANKMPSIGYVVPGLPPCQITSMGEAFLQGFRELGYGLEQTIAVDWRCYVTIDQARTVFIDRRVDVIVAATDAAGPEHSTR